MNTNYLVMEKIIKMILLALLLTITSIKSPAQNKSSMEGVWEGDLRLKFVWKIDRDADGNLSATFNVPEQKTFNIPVQNVIFKDDSLILEINITNQIKAKFAGKYDSNRKIIEGNYIDAQGSYPMTLRADTHFLETMVPLIDTSGQKVLKYRYKVPQKTNDDWQTASLSEAGIDSTLINKLMEKILNESFKNIHSVLIVKDGKLVLEEYFYGYKHDQKHFIASVTKSVTGTCAGIAKDQNLITDLNTPVCTYFPEYSKASVVRKRSISICIIC